MFSVVVDMVFSLIELHVSIAASSVLRGLLDCKH
jgi:hypothetical protein